MKIGQFSHRLFSRNCGRHYRASLTPVPQDTQTGQTLIEIIIGCAILSIIFLLAGGVGQLTSTFQSQSRLNQTVFVIEHSILETIADVCAWTNTANNPMNNSPSNQVFQCLSNASGCGSQGAVPFILYSRSNTLVYDATSPTSGYTSSGQYCTNYTGSNAACPIHVALTWQQICSSSSNCSNPLQQVVGQITYSSGTSTVAQSLSFAHSFNFSLPPKSCAYLAATTIPMPASGIYMIAPVSGTCPFQVYCDMTSDGGLGWTEIFNASTLSYAQTPVISDATAVTPAMTARFSDNQITAVLGAAQNDGSNNIKVVFQTGTASYVVAMNANGNSAPGLYSVTNPNACDAKANGYPADPSDNYPAAVQPQNTWGFVISQSANSFAGYIDMTSAAPVGYNGMACNSCSASPPCGAPPSSCCNGQLVGSVWVR